MSIYDSITRTAKEKFNLGDGEANGLMSGLLALMISDGGLNGFLARFRSARLGDTVDTWITTSNNSPLSNQQLESALGADSLSMLANQAGVTRSTATSAMAAIIPQVVDRLTPEGAITDDNEEMLSKLRGHLGGLGGAVLVGVGTAGAMATGVFDRVGNATDNAFDTGKDTVRGGINSVGNAAVAVGDPVNSMRADDNLDTTSDSSVLKWLLPLILLGLLVALGFWFCGKATLTTTVVTNSNVNANRSNTNVAIVVNNTKAVDSSFSIKADNRKYTIAGGNDNYDNCKLKYS